MEPLREVGGLRAGRFGRMADVPEDPTAIKELDLLLQTATIAHESIFEIRRELIASDQGSPEQAQLLEESARIATVDLPGLSAAARRLSVKWRDQVLLDAESAAKTLAELKSELARIKVDAESLLDRQLEIAARMDSMGRQ
jgi:hypothetical protein